jgi:hypothetical protein
MNTFCVSSEHGTLKYMDWIPEDSLPDDAGLVSARQETLEEEGETVRPGQLTNAEMSAFNNCK